MNKVKITWKLDMFGRVIFVTDANMDAINTVPALADGYADFKLRAAADNALAQDLPDEDENNGYAEHRANVWLELSKSLDRMCGGLRSYAKKNKNTVLFTQAKFSPTAFLKKRGTDAILLANSKLALLSAQVANLADYNVTPAKLTAAAALSAELATANPKPTAQRSVDKALRKMVALQIKGTTALLKDEIDPLVRSLEPDYPSFVEQYFNARRIQKTGIHHDKPEEAGTAPMMAEGEAKPTQDGGQPDTNGAQPPTESSNNGETSGGTA